MTVLAPVDGSLRPLVDHLLAENARLRRRLTRAYGRTAAQRRRAEMWRTRAMTYRKRR